MERILIDAAFVGNVVQPRKKSSHKRMNGTVCVVGGSPLYHGAPFLCAMGALRSGVDLVFLAVPAPIVTAVRSLSPDLIVIPLPDSKLTRGNVSRILPWADDSDSLAIGPGLGPQKPENVASAVAELAGERRGLVVDADALRPRVVPVLGGKAAILTPHAREFERTFGEKLPEDLDGRVATVSSAASRTRTIILLKGPTDVISDGTRVALNVAHTPAMTVGGTGDVLTGIAAGLLAKGAKPFEAACAAAFVNGSAGQEAAKTFGLHIAASDVVNQIANVMKRFDRLE